MKSKPKKTEKHLGLLRDIMLATESAASYETLVAFLGVIHREHKKSLKKS